MSIELLMTNYYNEIFQKKLILITIIISNLWLLFLFLPNLFPNNFELFIFNKIFCGKICHQIPERLFNQFFLPLSVCNRCAGIYLGLSIGSLISLFYLFKNTLYILLVSFLILCFDVFCIWIGVYSYNLFTSFSTGLVFGVALIQLFISNFHKEKT